MSMVRCSTTDTEVEITHCQEPRATEGSLRVGQDMVIYICFSQCQKFFSLSHFSQLYFPQILFKHTHKKEYGMNSESASTCDLMTAVTQWPHLHTTVAAVAQWPDLHTTVPAVSLEQNFTLQYLLFHLIRPHYSTCCFTVIWPSHYSTCCFTWSDLHTTVPAVSPDQTFTLQYLLLPLEILLALGQLSIGHGASIAHKVQQLLQHDD